MKRRLALVAMVAGASVCLAAQEANRPGRPAEGAVAGFVRFAGGEAIADVRVVLLVPGSREARSARTAANGSYWFEAVSAGEYQLSVSRPGSVAKRIRVAAESQLKDIDFSIPDGSSRRVVPARVVMNAASRDQQVPARIGIGVRWPDGTLAIPLAPGDQRLVVRLPSGYFLDSATYGSATVYSLESVGGRRLTSGAFSITVRPEPQAIPDLVITLGFFR
jgi:hypothetical protein